MTSWNSLQLHKPQGTGVQVADGIQLAMVTGLLILIWTYPVLTVTIQTVWISPRRGEALTKSYKLAKIISGDVSDTGGPFSRCSSSEMLNQLPFPFLEFTFQIIRLYGIGEFPTPKSLICALWFALDLMEVFNFSTRIWKLLSNCTAIVRGFLRWHIAWKNKKLYVSWV